MIRTVTFHRANMNKAAACEKWYWEKYMPQLLKKYSPWIEKLESFRTIVPYEVFEKMADEAREAGVDINASYYADGFGLTNWLVTSGYWKELPEVGSKGEMAFSSPSTSIFEDRICISPQCTEDYKGNHLSPDNWAPIRWVQFIKWPPGVSREEGDRWYNDVWAPFVSECSEVFRFFSFRALDEVDELAEDWKKENKKDKTDEMIEGPWDRMTEMWFESFADWRDFIEMECFSDRASRVCPPWAEREEFPFVGQDGFVSAFITERPDQIWK